MSTPVCGFDPSLSHSAGHWAPRMDLLEGAVVGGYASFAIKSEPKNYVHRLARLHHIRSNLLNQVHNITTKHGVGLFTVEGYAFGARNDRETLGEWGGQLRLSVYDMGWDVLEVPPTTLKKYVTGKGNTEKDGMRMEVLKRWSYESTDNNDCDAYALMRFGFDWLAWKRGEKTTQVLADSLSKGAFMSSVDAGPVMPEKPKKKSKAQRALEELQAANTGGL